MSQWEGGWNNDQGPKIFLLRGKSSTTARMIDWYEHNFNGVNRGRSRGKRKKTEKKKHGHVRGKYV
jgi:hypothetical protein